MQRIRSKDTKPELLVRRLVYGMGYRYRLHRKDLPGNPDMVFPGRRKVIFVHGCFWHQHEACNHGHIPKSNKSYWIPKLERTKKRDAENVRKLSEIGWHTFVVWECEIKDIEVLKARLVLFLG